MAERVLIELAGCRMKGEVHCGARMACSGGKSKLISLDSMEMQVFAENIEAGLG